MRFVPLRDVAIRELEPIFQEEVAYWQECICWDYQTTLAIIRNFVCAGTLPGLVLLEGSQVVGYSYYVVDHDVGFLGNLFVGNAFAGPQTYSLLVEGTFEAITQDSSIKRVETQLFEFNFNFAPLFRAVGCSVLPRHFMVKLLAQDSEDPGILPPGWQLSQWQAKYLLPTAEVIFDSYRDSIDASICRDYRDRAGCLRFLRNLIENPACGTFCPTSTLVALDHFGQVGGILLVTKTQETTAMIPQISIRRDMQGRGLGSYLLRRLFFESPQRGFSRVTLSVTDANSRAYGLYLRKGFRILKDFNAYIWERGR